VDGEFKVRLQENVLYDYAARNWGHHARAASTDVEQLILSFLECEAKVSASSQAILASRKYLGYDEGVPSEMTGVHLAAYFGLTRVLIALAKKGCDLGCGDIRGQTPLSMAAEEAHEEVVRLLVDRADVEADLRERCLDSTPLMWAARRGQEVVAELVDRARFKSRQESLVLAAEYGNEAVVRLLLEKGANFEAKDSHGWSALCGAVSNEKETVVRLLLDNGANSNESLFDLTVLHLAVRSGNETIVKLLLGRGADSNAKTRNWFGWTPLHMAVSGKFEAVVRVLVENGANVDAKADQREQTALHEAIWEGTEAIVRFLLKKNADMEAKTDSGHTALCEAICREHETIARLLLAQGANIHAEDTHGRTILHWAAASRQGSRHSCQTH
jgi:ankyrin repeat protein